MKSPRYLILALVLFLPWGMPANAADEDYGYTVGKQCSDRHLTQQLVVHNLADDSYMYTVGKSEDGGETWMVMWPSMDWDTAASLDEEQFEVEFIEDLRGDFI